METILTQIIYYAMLILGFFSILLLILYSLMRLINFIRICTQKLIYVIEYIVHKEEFIKWFKENKK